MQKRALLLLVVCDYNAAVILGSSSVTHHLKISSTSATDSPQNSPPARRSIGVSLGLFFSQLIADPGPCHLEALIAKRVLHSLHVL